MDLNKNQAKFFKRFNHIAGLEQSGNHNSISIEDKEWMKSVRENIEKILWNYQRQEELLKFVPSIEVRGMIRSRITTLI